MRYLPPFEQAEQVSEYDFDDYVPEFVDPITGEPLPTTSYRLRYNNRTESWNCDWYDSDGEPIDQGRRLSANWYIRTPWQNENYPDPMPGWLVFFDLGETGAECDFDGLGRTHAIVEYGNDDVDELDANAPPLYPFDVVISS